VLKNIQIENFKSIERVSIDLGLVNVFIGENGAGKSNILEAIALAGAAQAGKLDNEFLASRGIRVSKPHLMRSAFNAKKSKDPIRVTAAVDENNSTSLELTNDEKPYSTWKIKASGQSHISYEMFSDWINQHSKSLNTEDRTKFFNDLRAQLTSVMGEFENEKLDSPNETESKTFTVQISVQADAAPPVMKTGNLEQFVIYSPENSALRMFEREGQIEPLGINGEGLLKLLAVMASEKNKNPINAVKDSLRLFNWFDDFKTSQKRIRGRLEIFDQFLDQKTPSFDQRSANEGFLFLAFYLALFVSDLTPKFFAVDNVDTSLNPKLCEALMKRLVELTGVYGKQVLLTTHNPAILDGLDISDPENRLFIVSRNTAGQTRVRRFSRKSSSGAPQRLSTLFLSGALGGIPKGF
jgi:predicted ATPase